MAQMTNDQLLNYIISQGYNVAPGRYPGTLSVSTGDNQGYIVDFTTPEGLLSSQQADVANPAGFNAPYMVPADYNPQIANATFVPDWNQALKDANNGGGWVETLANLGLGAAVGMAGGQMLGIPGFGGGEYVDTLGEWPIAGTESIPSMGLDDLAVSSISGTPSTGALPWYTNPVQNPFLDAVGTGSATFNPATASVSDIVSAVSASSGNAIPMSALTPELAAAAASGASLSSLSPSLLAQLASTVSNVVGTPVTGGQLLAMGANALGGLLQGNAKRDAAQTAANSQLEAARIAAEAARFKPVGVTTNFGQSKFTTDAQGNVTGAGYTLNPTLQAQQNQLLGASGGMLNQFTGAQAATAPMGAGAQSLFNLGQGYLSTTPQQQAAKYYADQQALLATNRDRDRAALENRLMQQGRLGLATGATGAMTAANPEMEAFYNAQRQQDLGLAAQATQGGMDYAKFGAGMLGTGGDLLKSMYGTQVASYDPYKTALGGAQAIEGLGQNALDLSINIGKTASPAQSGQLLAQGMLGAAQTTQNAASSPWGDLLLTGGNALSKMANPQQQQRTWAFDPYTGAAIG
jgi:hypothetical protein